MSQPSMVFALAMPQFAVESSVQCCRPPLQFKGGVKKTVNPRI